MNFATSPKIGVKYESPEFPGDRDGDRRCGADGWSIACSGRSDQLRRVHASVTLLFAGLGLLGGLVRRRTKA